MKKTILLILAVVFVNIQFLNSQNKVVCTLEADDYRTNEFQHDFSIKLPACNITNLEFTYYDSTTNNSEITTIYDTELATELIMLLEYGFIEEIDTFNNADLKLNISTSIGETYKLNIIKEYVSVETPDTAFVISYITDFVFAATQASNSPNLYAVDLSSVNKVVMNYKKNIDSLLDSTEIAYFIKFFDNLSPTTPSSCPFYNSKIYFHTNSGIIEAAPAHDLCPVIKIDGIYYDMPRGTHCLFKEFMYKKVGFVSGP